MRALGHSPQHIAGASSPAGSARKARPAAASRPGRWSSLLALRPLVGVKSVPPPPSLVPAGGHGIDPQARAFFERRFGGSLDAVRVHTDGAAAGAAAAVDAAAYTVDRHIVFGAGRYQPATANGRRLLAHELAHVAQQQRPGAASPTRVARTPENGCTPERMHVGNPDGVIGAGFREAAAEVEEAIAIAEAARGIGPRRWWDSPREAAIIINYIFECPARGDLEFVIGRLREMRAYLVSGFPYECTTSGAACVPDSRGQRRNVTQDRVLSGGGHPGFLVTRGILICPRDVQDGNLALRLTGVAARLSGLRRGRRGDVRATPSYEMIAVPEMRDMAAASAADSCAAGTGIPVPEEQTSRGPEEERTTPPQPASGDRSRPHDTVYVDSSSSPVGWSNVMIPGFANPVDTRYESGHPPRFIVVGGRRFNLDPDHRVRPR